MILKRKLYLSLILTLVFAYTVWLRAPFFNTLSDWHNQWLTASTIKFTTFWYNEGPINLKWAMLESPPSFETPTIDKREIYPSYPSGTIVPLYLLAKIFNHEPNLKFIHIYNLANHLIITLLLFFLVFELLDKLDLKWRSILSLLSGTYYLLLPGPIYWHQNVFFSDQAVVLPFILAVFLELKKDRTSHKIYCYLLPLVLFWGLMTDWFYFVFMGLLFFKRLWMKKYKAALVLVGIGLLALGLFAYQLYILDVFPLLKAKFLIRTGMAGAEAELVRQFFKKFWLGHVAKQFGYGGPWFLLISFYLFIPFFFYKLCKKRLSEDKLELGNFIFLLSVPCLVQVYLLMNHSVVHDFSVLKFTLMMSAVPFFLLPQFFELPKKWVIILMILSVINLLYIHPRWHKMFVQPTTNYHVEAKQIRKMANFNDLYFSPNFVIQENPPQKMSFSMKRVYQIKTLQQMISKYDELVTRNQSFNHPATLVILPLKECAAMTQKLLNFLDKNTDKILTDEKQATFIQFSSKTFDKLRKHQDLLDRRLCDDYPDFQFI